MNNSDAIRAVRRMQRYIAAHIDQTITLRQLAQVAGYSPYHSARLFSRYTGRAPLSYIRSLRLSRAALRLRDGAPRVIDVALDYMFDSHEGFTRAFTREFGISPHKYSMEPVPIRLFMPESAGCGLLKDETEAQKMQESNAIPIFTQVIERPARKLLLKRGIAAEEYFAYCGEVGCDVWGVLCSIREALYEPVGIWLPDHLIAPGTSRYVHGVELPQDYAGDVPEGFDLIDLPPCTLMVFQGPQFDDEYFAEAVGQVWRALETYDPTLYGYEWDPQAAPRMQLAPQGSRGYIEMRPVKRISGK